jgi:hypothetical protein
LAEQRAVLHVPLSKPGSASAQSDDSGPDISSIGAAGTWVVVGAALVVSHVNCQSCEQEFPYRDAASALVDAGYRVNRRTNIGGEVFWIGTKSAPGRGSTIHLDAVGQFRPWASRGLCVKAGAGLAFVRNGIDVSGTASQTSKACR